MHNNNAAFCNINTINITSNKKDFIYIRFGNNVKYIGEL